ncbi:MAG TPA: Rid family detoxifying hydrolase [Gemmatimonadaceae bacterium]|nr:Rid family detoxifying hydrolase [Gemmatimonadaceae bacterium]
MADATRSWQPAFLPGDVPKPVGAYSPAVRAGDFVFISGQVPVDPKTQKVISEDFETQVRQTLSNVKAALGAAGATLDDVVSVIAYLTDMDDWGRFNDIYKETFRAPYPTRTAVGAMLRGFKVEVSAVAYLKR